MTGATIKTCSSCDGLRRHCDVCDGHGDVVVCAEPLCGEVFSRTEAEIEGYYCGACRESLDEPGRQ